MLEILFSSEKEARDFADWLNNSEYHSCAHNPVKKLNNFSVTISPVTFPWNAVAGPETGPLQGRTRPQRTKGGPLARVGSTGASTAEF